MTVEHWEAYYRGGAIATCPMGPGTCYTLELRELWIAFFASLADGARVLDLGTGNGAIVLLAKEAAASTGRRFEIHGADLASIDPARHVPDGADCSQASSSTPACPANDSDSMRRASMR